MNYSTKCFSEEIRVSTKEVQSFHKFLFRISSMWNESIISIKPKVYRLNDSNPEGYYLSKDKYWCREITVNNVLPTLQLFFYDGIQLRTKVINMILEKLKNMRRVMTDVFFSSQVLDTYKTVFFKHFDNL